jgi:hypothetical protein
MRRRQKGLYALGEALRNAVDTAMNGARVPCTAYALRILGQKLMRIADGHVATKIFAQDKSGRPNTSERDCQIALIYWAARARGDHSRGRAVKAVRAKLPDLKLADSAIHDIAKRRKDYALGTEETAGALEFDDLTNGLPGIDAAEVKRRTTRRDGRGNKEWQALDHREGDVCKGHGRHPMRRHLRRNKGHTTVK